MSPGSPERISNNHIDTENRNRLEDFIEKLEAAVERMVDGSMTFRDFGKLMDYHKPVPQILRTSGSLRASEFSASYKLREKQFDAFHDFEKKLNTFWACSKVHMKSEYLCIDFK